MLINTLLIFTCVLLGSLGQIFQKLGINRVVQSGSVSYASLWEKLVRFLSHPWVLLGLTCYGIAAMVWIFLLSRVPVSWAYPFLGLTYFLVMVLSVIFLHERITPFQILGAGFIWLGVFLLFRASI